MSLDLFVSKVKMRKGFDLPVIGARLTTIDATITELDPNFWQWKGFYALHNWMQHLYLLRGGTEEFNEVNLELTADDLNKLQQDIPNLDQYSEDEESIEPADLSSLYAFIDSAQKALSQGYQLYYCGWY